MYNNKKNTSIGCKIYVLRRLCVDVYTIFVRSYYLFYLNPTSFFVVKYFTILVDISPLSGSTTTHSFYILYVNVFTIIFFKRLSLIIIIIIIVYTVIFTLSHDKTLCYQFIASRLGRTSLNESINNSVQLHVCLNFITNYSVPF